MTRLAAPITGWSCRRTGGGLGWNGTFTASRIDVLIGMPFPTILRLVATVSMFCTVELLTIPLVCVAWLRGRIRRISGGRGVRWCRLAIPEKRPIRGAKQSQRVDDLANSVNFDRVGRLDAVKPVDGSSR
jgi:hypothetical protein